MIFWKIFIICEANMYEHSNRMKNLYVMLFLSYPCTMCNTHHNPQIILNRYHITHPDPSLVIS
ncbi:hypothetical protein HanRHA438_Chr13g0622361 [Helianthus annuus]|nr:hypothetical protein HanRHA438_Chr13g0622361 [Helianthus annuus]